MSDSAFYHSLIGSCGQLLSCYLLSRQKSFVWFIKLSILAGLSPIVDVIGQSGSRECDLVLLHPPKYRGTDGGILGK